MSGTDFSLWRDSLSRVASPVLRGGCRAAEGEATVAVASPAALLLLSDETDLYPSLVEGFRTLAAVGRAAHGRGVWPMLADAQGHTRGVYHALTLHLFLAAFTKRYETLPVGMWSACEDAMADAILPARVVERYTDVAPPPESTDLVLWQALCVLEQALAAGRDVDVEVVDGVVHQIVSRPGRDGALHPMNGDESLDAWTYRELCGLHALASLSLLRRNRAWAAHVERVAWHHVENTQPDNTTSQPWGWFGFFWSPKTRSFAEQQLHDATANDAGLVAALLLADAANALSTFVS